MLVGRASDPQIEVPESESCPVKKVCLVVKHFANKMVVADGKVIAVFFDAAAAMGLKNGIDLLDGGGFFHLKCVMSGYINGTLGEKVNNI